MTGCCVPQCKNRTEKGFRLFRLPTGEKNAHRRNFWLQCIGRSEINPSSMICEVHFSEEQFERKRKDDRRLLRAGAVPDLLTTVDITNSQQAGTDGACTENASDQKRTSVGLEELNSDCTDKIQDTTSRWRAIRDNYVRSLRKQAQHAESGVKKIRPYIYGKELSFLNKSKELPTAEVNFEDNTDDRADNVDADVRLGSSEATFEDNSNELSYDPLDYVDEIKTEADGGNVYVRPTEASFENNVTETSHDRADYVSEIKTEADDIDIIEEELVNSSPINNLHATKRKRLNIQHASMDFRDAVTVMKSPLQEDEDLAFFYSLLPSVRSLNTDQKFTFRLKTMQLLQDIRNSSRINASIDTDSNM
ncbi:hypothetical protein MTP99_000644 [Tenebrio molitor]|nr:hypothetical protein MTP99_000644 [Tenebrio molitor]